MLDDAKWRNRLEYVKRLRHAMSVIDKFPDDGPVCKNKDVAEAVAELMRIADDAACFIELNQFSFIRKPHFLSTYLEGDLDDVTYFGTDNSHFWCENCINYHAGKELEDWQKRITVVKCTSRLKDGTSITYWSGICPRCNSIAICGEPAERKRIIDAMRSFENRMSDGLYGVYYRGFDEVKQEINDFAPAPSSALAWLLGRE